MEIPALTVAKIYKVRWQIELFFKWIKGHLRINKDPDLDRGCRLPHGGHPSQAAPAPRQTAQNFPTFEYSSF